jgi:hypothetical protein
MSLSINYHQSVCERVFSHVDDPAYSNIASDERKESQPCPALASLLLVKPVSAILKRLTHGHTSLRRREGILPLTLYSDLSP